MTFKKVAVIFVCNGIVEDRMSDGETSISTRSSYREAFSTQHGAVEYGSDLDIK